MLIKGFITYLSHEKRYSSHTITSYSKDLFAFEEYISSSCEVDILEVVPAHIRSFMIKLMEDQLTNNTVNNKLSALRSFYKQKTI